MATLGEQAVGSIVKLNVNGVATNFIVVHQGLPGTMYDSSCDGTWLLMEKCYTRRAWHTSGSNDYEKSSIHAYLNGDFFGLLDSAVKDLIKQVKIPYRPGSGKSNTVASGADGLSTKIFLLSTTELSPTENITPTYIPVMGAVLDYFNGAQSSKLEAYFEGSEAKYWTRSPHTNRADKVGLIQSGGWYGSESSTLSSIAVRPALIFPQNMNVLDNGLIDGTLAPTGAITGTVLINGVMRELTGKGYINIGGILRDLSDSQVNIGGVLKSLKG